MTLAATILSFASPPSPSPLGEGRGEQHLAIVTDRRLSAAALTALFLRDGKYRLIGEARGVNDVRQLLGTFHPSVTILDASWVAGRPPLDVTRCDGSGRLLVILDPADG